MYFLYNSGSLTVISTATRAISVFVAGLPEFIARKEKASPERSETAD
jgi:hypothetical protein